MVTTSSRRAGRVTNKTKLLIYRGNDKVDLGAAEIIVWDNDNSTASDEPKSAHHLGAKGVESGELLEHHLQAALSSASLLHSNASTKPASPSSTPRPGTTTITTVKADPNHHATLNYHIPTPDATGLVQKADYAELYETHQYHEPVNFIRFSDTVEQSSEGLGGLGYCMDDEDVQWLTVFNAKGEGSSGESGAAGPAKEIQGRPQRHKEKGKEKEKEIPAALHITEDVFEYVMGVMEKNAETTAPTLHTDLSLMPTFSSVESLFASIPPATFFPSAEQPRGVPEPKLLSRIARSIYDHWKSRKEIRKGRSVQPMLNFDETNDNDPYVCFRRRDQRQTRKTRRTDNYSVERFQRIQVELRQAHNMTRMVLEREKQKRILYKADKEVWEAKWKLFETKRRWPSLGMSVEEAEVITGRPAAQPPQPTSIPTSQISAAMQAQQQSLANLQARRAKGEREREERERRERAQDAARQAEKGLVVNRTYAPEVLKQRILDLSEQLEEILAQRKEQDAAWDDDTDRSYQPLPPSYAEAAFRPLDQLDPQYARYEDELPDNERPARPLAFRMRRGRGGILRLDRRLPSFVSRRGAQPSGGLGSRDWLFPSDNFSSRPSRRRPRSIDEVEDEVDVEEKESELKRRKMDEVWRYDTSRGGALGVGMGLGSDEGHFILDDLDAKYIRARVSLLTDEDAEKLRPDQSLLEAATAALEAPVDLPPTPIFNKPAVVQPNPHFLAAQAHQQQLMQQQQRHMEQFQQYQLLAQQQAALQQQQAALAAQQQQAAQPQNSGLQLPTGQQQINGSVSPAPLPAGGQQAMAPPNGTPGSGRPGGKRPLSSNGAMGPPAQARTSLSPTNPMHPSQLPNGASPQMLNHGLLPNGKTMVQPNGGTPLTPAMQQMLAAKILQSQGVQNAAIQLPNGDANGHFGANGAPVPAANGQITQQQLAAVAQSHGFGNDVAAFLAARQKANLMANAKQAQMQQTQLAQLQAQQAQGANGTGQGTPGGGAGANGAAPFSPTMASAQMNLKLPAKALTRLASNPGVQPQAQRT